MLKRVLRDELGAGLLMASVATFVLGAAGYYTLELIDSMDANRRNLDLNIKARLVAEDAVEATKYLLFYEKVILMDRAQSMPEKVRNFDSSTSNLINWIKTCGDLQTGTGDGNTELPKTDFEITLDDNKNYKVFCPLDLRDFRVSGDIYEVQLEKFSQMCSGDDCPIQKIKPGIYKVGPFFFKKDDTDWSPGPEEDLWLDFGLNKITDGRIKEIQTNLFIYTRESGFVSVDSERFIKIESRVAYGQKNEEGNLSTSYDESFMLRASSMKEFSAFFAYPTKASLPESLGVDDDSNFYGKVFYRGGYDFKEFNFDSDSVSGLPNFKDMVIFSEAPDSASIPAPSAKNIALLRSKFSRGFVFSIDEDFIFDSANVSNKTGGLEKSHEIEDYIQKSALCSAHAGANAKVTINNEGISDCSVADVGTWGGNMIPLKGGKIGKAVIKNITSFVMAASPIFRFEVDSTVYGVLVGGKITGGNKVDFYALPNLKEGLPGLSGAGNDLTNMIQQANSTFQLVGVPFINIPMVIRSK